MQPKVMAIIQARMASSRLPGKVLLDIAGQPMLGLVHVRTRRARRVDDVLVATTTDDADEPICEYCEAHGIRFTRGSQFDVLDRYYQAARKFEADIVLRITADCPAIDPQLIDEAVDALRGPVNAGVGDGPQMYPDFAFDFASTSCRTCTRAWSFLPSVPGLRLECQAAAFAWPCSTRRRIMAVTGGRSIRPRIWNSCGRSTGVSAGGMISPGQRC